MRVTTLLGLFLAAAVIVGIIAAANMGWFSPSKSALTDELVLDIPKSDIVGIVVTREGAPPLRLVRVRDQWRMTSPLWGLADEDQVRRAVDAIAGLRIARQYAFDDPDRPRMAKAGLDKPRMKLTVLDVRDQRHEIRFGTQPKLIQQRYAQIDQGDDIYLVGPDPVELLSPPLGTFRHKKLLEFDPALLTRLIVAGRANYELIRRNGRWRLSGAGFADVAADEAKMAELINRLKALEISDVTPGKATDLEAFGLEPAGLVLVLMFQRQPGQLSLSPPSDPSGPDAIEVSFGSQEGNIYVMLEGDLRLLKIAPADYEALVVPAGEIRDRRVLPIRPGQIAAIDVILANRTSFSLKRDGDRWIPADLGAKPDGEASMKRLVEALTSMRAESFITRYASLSGYGLETPAARLVVTDESGSVHTLLFGQCDDAGKRAYLKRVDDRAVMMVTGDDLAAMIDTIAGVPGFESWWRPK